MLKRGRGGQNQRGGSVFLPPPDWFTSDPEGWDYPDAAFKRDVRNLGCSMMKKASAEVVPIAVHPHFNKDRRNFIMAPAGTPVSFRPSDMVDGGLLDNVTVLWRNPKFGMFDYNGKQAPVPAALIMLVDPDTGDELQEQAFTVGDAKDWAPSPDGKTLIPVGTQTALRSGSNFGMLVKSLIDAGFPEDKISNDVSLFGEMICHMVRIPAPTSRATLKKKPRADGREFDPTVFIVESIVKMPWDKQAAPGTGKAGAGAPKGAGKAAANTATANATPANTATASTATASAPPAGDAVSEATSFLLTALASSPAGIAKKDIPAAAFKALQGNPLFPQIVQLLYNDDFLSKGPWSYVDQVLKLG